MEFFGFFELALDLADDTEAVEGGCQLESIVVFAGDLGDFEPLRFGIFEPTEESVGFGQRASGVDGHLEIFLAFAVCLDFMEQYLEGRCGI